MARLHYLPPTEQICKSFVPARYIGFSLIEYFASRFPYLPEKDWASIIRNGRVTVSDQPVGTGFILKEHDHIVTRLGKRLEPPANREIQVLYEDNHIRIFNKAAPIPVHPSGRYYKNSMTELLKEVYPEEIPRPVQRLDAATTGALIFAKSRKAAAFLMDEFANQRVYKEYLAVVEGIPKTNRFVIDTPIGKINGSKRATGNNIPSFKPAVTEFQLLSSMEGRSLLKVVPHSGRTNQIRVHLSSIGFPIINDPVYGKKLCEGPSIHFGLHAYRLRFRCFEVSMEVAAPWPSHFRSYICNSQRSS